LPTYEYRCRSCGEQLEVVQAFTDDPLTTHEACGGELRKVFGSVGISFKGSGFYKNDSRSKTSSSKAPSESSAGSADTSDSGGTSAPSDKKNGSGSSDKAGSSASTSSDTGKSAPSSTASTSKPAKPA
jgi:putative FmdB family regulatory protein